METWLIVLLAALLVVAIPFVVRGAFLCLSLVALTVCGVVAAVAWTTAEVRHFYRRWF